MPSRIQHADIDLLARLFKGLEMDDRTIGSTPGGHKIYASRGASHEGYANMKPADHIVAANMHAKAARDANIQSGRLGGSATLKRQAANHLHIATGHRELGMGASQAKLAASMASHQYAQIYRQVIKKASASKKP